MTGKPPKQEPGEASRLLGRPTAQDHKHPRAGGQRRNTHKVSMAGPVV
jgi:hypothetical protein